MLIRIKYCLTGQCSQEGVKKGIEAFDCAASNPGIAVMAQRMSMRIPVSCHRADASFTPGSGDRNFICTRSNVGVGVI
jgi:hypothetical protein